MAKSLTDEEGLLAFAYRRGGWGNFEIADILGADVVAVRTFFFEYSSHWPRALRVPKRLTPDILRQAEVSRGGGMDI